MSVVKRGGKYWIDFRYNRVRYRKASPDNSSSGAKAYEAMLRQRLAQGGRIFEQAEKKKEEIPLFKDFTEKWFDVYVKTNNKYSETLNKESLLRAHLVPYFGNKRLDKINTLDVESYKSQKIEEGQSNKSINNHLIVLNKCFITAKDWEVISNTPKVKLLKVEPQKFDFLNVDECQRLLNACNDLTRDMVLMGLKTGLRFGELIALTWSDIDFTNCILTVQKSIARGRLGSPKSNKIRHVPLLPDVIEMLNRRPKISSLVFDKGDDKHLVPVFCLRYLHKACKDAGIRKIGWHTLRHTFASHLAQNSVSIVIIKDLLGHADIKTTMRYSHLSPSVVRGAIETLDSENGHNMVTICETRENKPIEFKARELKLLEKT